MHGLIVIPTLAGLILATEASAYHVEPDAHSSSQSSGQPPAVQPPAASSPSISLDVPSQVPLGANVSFSATFDNPDPADVGCGPIIDIILDTTGADAESDGGPYDGLGTSSISASYLGIPFTTGGSNPTMWVIAFNSAGEATHPLIRDASGNYITVTGPRATPWSCCVYPLAALPLISRRPRRT